MQRDRHVAVWLRMLAEKEIGAARNANKLLKAQGKKIAASYREGGLGEAESTAKKGQAEWGRLLVAHYSKAIRDFADYTFEQLGHKKQKKSNFMDIVQGFIARESFKKSNLITHTNLNVLRDAVSAGVDAGEGEKEIAGRINESIGGSLAENRARTIARTEVHNAASFGMQTAAEDTERNLIREWVSVHDQRTRDWHAEADGQTRGMDEPFEVNDEFIDRPGEGSPENAINCRCTLTYTPITNDYESGGDGGDDGEELI